MSVKVSVPLPVFVTVTGTTPETVPTFCAGKLRLVGVKLIPAAAVTPVQVNATV